jgi:tetraacyldisaccharide 4'-kinase
MRAWAERAVLAAWYGGWPWTWIFLPLEWLYRAVVSSKRNNTSDAELAVPVLVVGNIVVGGAGKTPLTLALAASLREQGFNPGIVSRGYGGSCQQFPHIVEANDGASLVGDEPKLMALRGFKVCIDPQRMRAAQALIDVGCDLILCDDGLQHYALPRDIEIAVFDGVRMDGNGRCLPVGPLREPLTRLAEVDAIIINGRAETALPGDAGQALALELQPQSFVNIDSGERMPVQAFITQHEKQSALAISGIANTRRFFNTLSTLGLSLSATKSFPDHHGFSAADLPQTEGLLLMTEKDAVKCAAFAPANAWYLEVAFSLPQAFVAELTQKLRAVAAAKSKGES